MQDVGSRVDDGEDYEEDNIDLTPGLGRDSRAFDRLPYELQSTTTEAARIIEEYTLYKMPLVSAGQVLLLVDGA